MQCPECRRDVPMSFKCRACGAPLVRASAPPPPATPRPVVPAVAPPLRSAPPWAPRGQDHAAGAPEHTDAAEPVNPYAAPARQPSAAREPVAPRRADISLFAERVDVPLAGRWERFAAQLLDGLLSIGCVLPGVVLFVVSGGIREHEGLASTLMVLGTLLLLAGFIGLLIYQLRLLRSEGQTWGKMKMKVRIVLYDTGEIPGLGRTLGMRIFVNNIIGSIPCVGPFYSLLDPIFIFGPERRCLHDLLAGTKVVEAG